MTMIGKKSLCIAVSLFLLSCGAVARAAACTENKDEDIRSEKIGYFTTEIGLSPSEAEKFWPVYNEAFEKKMAAIKKIVCLYKELKAISKDSAADKEKISAKTQEYLSALARINEIDREYLPAFQSILSPEKVARMYVAEESFRHRMFGKKSKK